MLDQKTFLQGINYLKANYINWNFDLNNELMLKVWYKKFSQLEPSIFMGLVEKYTDIVKYAPNSPADLLELLTTQLTQKELDADEAWQLILDLYEQYYYSSDKILSELEDKPALLKTYKAYYNNFSFDFYTMQAFKKSYEKNLKRQIDNQKSLLTGSNIYFLN